MQALRNNGLGGSNHGRLVEEPVQDSASGDVRGVVTRRSVRSKARVDADERKELVHHLRRIAPEVVEEQDLDLLPRKDIEIALHATVVEALADVARIRRKVLGGTLDGLTSTDAHQV